MIRSSGREAIQLFNGLRGIYWADIDAVGLKMDRNEKKRSFSSPNIHTKSHMLFY